MFNGKKILITGGTGSFGNAVLRRFLETDIQEVIIFSRDEKKQDEMRTLYRNDKMKFIIGDIRDYTSVLAATSDVDYIFHAAALKQVPSCEFYPWEAVKTNIIGTENLLNAAKQNKVKKTICLSTDKAVYPIKAMGISKAMMEKVMTAKARTLINEDSVVCGTRYGNVMASRGSVIPLFIQQIQTNQPLTITDPEMTRFMMTLDDAVDLVLFAFNNGQNGDIFVQKAPAATIAVLAKALVELMGVPNHPIKVVGSRHGEKIYETLLSREEMAKAIDHGDYYQIQPDNRDLNYDKYLSEGSKKIELFDDYNSHNTYRLNVDEMKKLLLKLNIIQNVLNS